MTHVPLFGNAGRRAAAPAPPPTPPPAPRDRQTPGDPVSGQAERLGQQLREIAAGTVAPEEAFEPALRAILESTTCAAGAICLYDQRHEMLRLAAEVGLSDEGCKHLRSVGGGSTWDMPLHGLRNRRAYLIDSASQNRYVPALVEGTAQTIACIPLHSGVTPLGSLVLITVRPRVLGERDIRMIERPLRELIKMVEMIRRRGPGAATGAPPPAPAAAAPAPRPAAPAPAPAPAAPAPAPSPAASAPAAPPAPTAVADDGARLAEVEAALAVEREQGAALTTQLAHERRLRGEAEAALAAERQVRAQLEAAAPDASAAEERRALETALAEAQRARADVGTALADAQRARTELEQALAAERSKHEAALDEARQGRTELEASVAEERRLRAESERSLAEERAARETAQAEVRDARAELEALVAEERRLRSEAEAALARERALREETETARANAEREAADAATRARTADDQAARAQAQLMEAQAHARAVDEARAAATSSAGTASDALAQAEAETRTLRDRVADLDGQLDALRAERDELRRSLEGSAAEQEALAASLDAVRAEQAQLRAALEEARAGREALAVETSPAAAAPVAPAPPAAGQASVAPPAPEPAAAPPAPVEITGEPGVVVLDVDGQWGEVAPTGTRVVALAPGADVVERMAGTAPTTVIVNLAAPGALAGLAALRAAGVSAPAFACVAAAGRALALGGMDVVLRPIDTDNVVVAVLRASSGPGRLVTVSGDVEALLSVRQALTRKGTSVSMAWDSKQALDLLGMMRPDVVLVDLELGKQACAVVAALEGVEPVPSLLIVPADVDQAEAFVALTRDAQRVARMVPLKSMVAAATKGPEPARKPA